MKVSIVKRYYKRSSRKRSPASFHAKQPRGVGTEVHAVVKLDPVLKKHRDLRNGVLKHEREEIRAWGQGHDRPHSHARTKEPRVTRSLGGTRDFWKEIDRREKR